MIISPLFCRGIAAEFTMGIYKIVESSRAQGNDPDTNMPKKPSVLAGLIFSRVVDRAISLRGTAAPG
jgi:hypothetical protein